MSETAYASSTAQRIFRPFALILLKYFTTTFSPRLRITGRHRVPRHGAVIICPNHLSNADPPYMYHALLRPAWYMAKSELFAMSRLGEFIRLCQAYPVEQGSADRAALQYTHKLLEHGQAVVIFPEGHCSPDGKLGPVQPGVIMLALRAGVPVIPVGIKGTDQVCSYFSMLPKPTLAPVRIHFGEPVQFNDLAALPRREQRKAAHERLTCALQKVAAIVGVEVRDPEAEPGPAAGTD